jgi:hypothetical protein
MSLPFRAWWRGSHGRLPVWVLESAGEGQWQVVDASGRVITVGDETLRLPVSYRETRFWWHTWREAGGGSITRLVKSREQALRELKRQGKVEIWQREDRTLDEDQLRPDYRYKEMSR